MTASPEQLIRMLLDRAVAELEIGRGLLDDSRWQDAAPHLSKAQDIVTELRCSLNLEAGGQIASNLDALYDFAFRRIVDGQIQHEASIIGEVVSVLDPIRDAWTTAVCGAAAPVTELRSVGAGA